MHLDKAIFAGKNQIKTTVIKGTTINWFRKDPEDQAMEAILVTQSPKSWAEWTDGKGPYVHEGEEIHYLLDGELVDYYDGHEYHLKEGDYFYFQGMKPHTWMNPGERFARMLIVVAPTLAARTDYYDHLSPEDREYAYRRMKEFGIKPPEEKPTRKPSEITKGPMLVRKNDFERQEVGHVTAELPTPGVRDQEAEICLVTVDPKSLFEWTDGKGPFRHEGEEFLYVVSGTINARVGSETRILENGDYVYFPGIIPHRFENIGDSPAQMMIGESPPIVVRPDYYDHLSPEDREYAYRRMKEFGIKPPEEKP
jgi:quercetin dioxygenase-like cupin family protein